MNFNDIVGQEVIVKSLQNSIKNNMIANAYIINGPKGSGRKTLADIFARGINCRSKDIKPCNMCPSCKKAIAGVNPDIIYIKPTGSSIKIQQIRQLISDVSVKPYENLYRVIIVEDGDKLTQESQDAFLKTLEEPEGNNVFILLTENYNSLLPTIISRCQIYNTARLSKDDMERVLKRFSLAEPEDIKIAIENSDGIIGKAIEIIENKDFKQQLKEYEELLKTAMEGSRVKILNLTEKMIATKEDCTKLLGFLLNFFRDILIFDDMEDNKYIINKSIDSNIMSFYKKNIKEDELFLIIDTIEQIITVMDFNVSYKNSIDSLFLKIMEVFNGKGSRSTI